ncbi:MAG: iron-siderophore ABC transporter substrate-binding protein, partial [Egibacteraceae bacterium]
AAVAGEGGADLSDERMDLLEADVLVWTFLEAGELEDNAIYQRLAVVREGRVVVLDELVGGALAWGTVLSLPFAIDDLVPQLAAAIDGDPAT